MLNVLEAISFDFVISFINYKFNNERVYFLLNCAVFKMNENHQQQHEIIKERFYTNPSSELWNRLLLLFLLQTEKIKERKIQSN